MKRTDIHRPSAINPDEYRFVCLGNVKVEELGDCYVVAAERRTLEADIARTKGTWADHDHGGTCHICGAYAVWTVIFHHGPSNTYIKTGNDCADKMEMSYGDMNAFKKRVAAAESNRAGRGKAQLILTEKGLFGAWDVYLSNQQYAVDRAAYFATGDWKDEGIKFPALSYEEQTVGDIVGKLVTYGNMSEAQERFLHSLLKRLAERPAIEAQRAAEAAAAEPVPVTNERIRIEGEVLSVKVVESDWGSTTKVLVRTDAGWKVFGKKPVQGDLTRGERVSFMARVEPSKDDPKMGWFSRPTRGEVVA